MNNINNETDVAALEYSINYEINNGKNEQYVIEDTLSRTKSANVYKVLCIESNNIEEEDVRETNFVIKTSCSEPENKEKSNLCLIKEQEVLSYINHKNIIKCINFFEYQDFPHLVLEYIQGETLSQKLTVEEALLLISQIGKAVKYLHEELPENKRILHLDIKPSNIMFLHSSNKLIAKLIDFGSTEKLQDLSNPEYQRRYYSKSGAYTAPEIESQRPDVTADIYSLTATLYFALTGNDPLFDPNDSYDSDEDDDNSEYINRRREEISKQLDSLDLNKGVKKDVKAAILSGMALQPEERPQSVKEWLALLPKMKERTIDDLTWSFQSNAAGSDQTYYFILDEENKPIKIGDGTYSIIYLGSTGEEGLEDVAIKVFYDKSPNKNSQFAQKESTQATGTPTEKPTEVQEKNLAEKRFYDELTSRQTINTNRKKNHQNSSEDTINSRGIIETQGGTTKFKKSPAYTNHSVFFEEGERQISNYVSVLTKYDMSLNAFLEGKGRYIIHDEDDSCSNNYSQLKNKIFFSYKEAIQGIHETVRDSQLRQKFVNNLQLISGYYILKSQSFKTRVKNVLAILYPLADGLLDIHQANKYHLDLKPQNIFIRRSGQDSFEIVIGDLGWMAYDPENPVLYLEENLSELPLGTLDFRSPEQKNYKTIADVKITSDKKIIIKNPLFKTKLIEKGDYVVFSKNWKKVYQIKNINFTSTSYSLEKVEIELVLSPEQRKELQEDNNTQCYFYKKIGIRTDLFGFGGTALNLLTAGGCPEDFYSFIRIFDQLGRDTNELIEIYQNITIFQSTQPDIARLFDIFKKDENSNEYLPVNVVAFILKCMMYKANNSFYRSNSGDIYENPTQNLRNAIKKLVAEYSVSLEDNILYANKLEINKDTNNPTFIKKIREIQNLPPEDFSIRLAHGFWCLKNLAECLNRIYNYHNTSEATSYLVGFHPENLFISTELDNQQSSPKITYRNLTYKSKDEYLEDLRKDKAIVTLFIESGSRFIPDIFYPNQISQEISLKVINPSDTNNEAIELSNKEDNDADDTRKIVNLSDTNHEVTKLTNKENNNTFKYQGASIYQNEINIGDWLIVKSSNLADNILLSVVGVDNKEPHIITVKPQEDSGGDNIRQIIENGDAYSIVCYKNIEPIKYYLYLIGVYTFTFFFDGINCSNFQEMMRVYNQIKNRVFFRKRKEQDFNFIIEKLQTNLPNKVNSDKKQKPWWSIGKGKDTDNEQIPSQGEILLQRIQFLSTKIFLKAIFHESDDAYYNTQRSKESSLTETQKNYEIIGALIEDIGKLQEEIAKIVGVRKFELNNLLEKDTISKHTIFKPEDYQCLKAFYHLVEHQHKIETFEN